MKLEEFLADRRPWPYNAWVNYRHGSIYLRKCDRTSYGVPTTLDIANVTFQPRGTGGFTAMLDELEPKYGIYIENVTSDRFKRFLERRGYALIAQGDLYSYPYCLARPCSTPPVDTASEDAYEGDATQGALT